MRATKITKYFEYDNKNPLNFFPTKQKREEKNMDLNNNLENTAKLSHNPIASNISSSSFDTINIQLETKYYTCGSAVEYFIYFNNYSQMDIKGTITNVGTSINGDLMALYEALKYIVYHPNMSQKLNKYKFNIYTNSNNISNIIKPDSNIIETNIYIKIQSLLRCVKNISIEYWSG